MGSSAASRTGSRPVTTLVAASLHFEIPYGRVMPVAAEALTFVLMIATFLVLATALRLPAALSTAGAALAGLVACGEAGSLYHLVEGAFGYLDVIIVIGAAMVFMKALEEAGILEEISTRMARRFAGRRVPLALASMLLVMLPGMLTGSSTAAALTTGRFVLPVLAESGFSLARAGAFVALGSLLGMIAPPVNIPAMIIGSGIDMPYVGFDLPLMAVVVPLAIATALWASVGPAGRGVGIGMGGYADSAERPGGCSRRSGGLSGGLIYLPLAVVLGLMIMIRVSDGRIPDPGIPFIFAVGTLVTLFCGRRFSLWKAIVDGVGLALPVMGILVGAGMFVQVMTLSGARGLLVTGSLDIPRQFLLLAAAVVVPAFGAISAYASASVMGIPLLLALTGGNEIVTASGLSLLAGIGDLIPPIAVVPTLVSQAMGDEPGLRSRMIGESVGPVLLFIAWSLAVVWLWPLVAKVL